MKQNIYRTHWLTGILKSGGGGMNGGGIPRPQRGSYGTSKGGRYPHASAGGGPAGRPYKSPSSYLEITQSANPLSTDNNLTSTVLVITYLQLNRNWSNYTCDNI